MNWDCLLSFRGIKYSVPYQYAGEQVWGRSSRGNELLIYNDNGEEVATHKLSFQTGGTIMMMLLLTQLLNRLSYLKELHLKEISEIYEAEAEKAAKTKLSFIGYLSKHIQSVTDLTRSDDNKTSGLKSILSPARFLFDWYKSAPFTKTLI